MSFISTPTLPSTSIEADIATPVTNKLAKMHRASTISGPDLVNARYPVEHSYELDATAILYPPAHPLARPL
jgi:hypothetical protein